MYSKILEELRRRPMYYVTHRQQAAMGDPVGDPFGGPAYGEKNGPAVALLGAFGSISMGITIGASTLMGGLMIAGGVMSGLGAITGNKTLSQLGMVAGLAGGVGQFFSSGGFDAFSNAFSAGDGISGGLSNMADQFMGNTDFGYGYPGNDVPGLDQAGQALQDAGNASRVEAILNGTPPTTIGGADQAFGVRAADGGGLMAPAGSTPDAALNATSAPVTAPGNNLSLEGLGQYPNSLNKLPLEGVAPKTGIMGTLGKVGAFIEKNPLAAAMGAQVLGNGVSGAVAGQQAEDALKAGEPLRDAQTRRTGAEATALEQRNTIKANAAGAGAGSVGKFASNKDAGPWGVDPKTGAKRTAPEFYAYMADQWKSAYGQGVPA